MLEKFGIASTPGGGQGRPHPYPIKMEFLFEALQECPDQAVRGHACRNQPSPSGNQSHSPRPRGALKGLRVGATVEREAGTLAGDTEWESREWLGGVSDMIRTEGAGISLAGWVWVVVLSNGMGVCG